MIEKAETGIHSKKVERTDKTVKITVRFVVPTRNNGVKPRVYTARDARRWLTDSDIKIGNCIHGARVSNLDHKQCATIQEGVWVFAVPVEEPEPPAVKKKPARKAKVTNIKESVGKDQGEFEGLNYDGDSVEKKTKTTRSRKRKGK